MRLERFVRESVLPRAHLHTTARRWVLEVLGEAGRPCTARTVNSDEDCILCTLGVGHFDPEHRAGASIWNGSGAACIPHAAIEGPQE
ncbi:hypothetical protein [Streptomyces liangshanensis]|uniref:hypothetical protein n=1 Tax=Streptomyces liangshanensis TaxID=2717324 RepID=UPI0036DC6986